MTTIKLSEAKAHLGKYVHNAAAGRRYIVSDRNKPIAQIIAVSESPKGIQPKLGLRDGQTTIPDDFDAPLTW